VGKNEYIKNFPPPQKYHSTCFNGNIKRPDDGNFPIAQELSDVLQAKFVWGLVTP
jgi:hypothetical protein